MARTEGNLAIAFKNFEGVEYTNSSAASAGELVVLDNETGLVGIAHDDYDATEKGVYYVKGVWQLPIADGVTVSQFDRLYWDVSANKVINTGWTDSDFYLGYAVKAGTAAGGYVDVALNERVEVDRNEGFAVFQGAAALDLTDASSNSTQLAPSGLVAAAEGGDVVVPIRAWAYVTTTIAADDTAPVVTIQDDSGNSTGLTISFTNGDAANDLAFGEIADGAAVTAVNLTSEGLQAAVTTAAVDAGTAAGEAKIIVECLLIK